MARNKLLPTVCTETMGISGFHSSTKHYLESTNITKYRKCRIGIDASAWLHRGAVPYALEIFQGTMPWTRVQGALPPWVEFPMRMIHMMRSHDIEPILVFDGCRSPAKAPTSEMRRDKKEKARQRALDSLERGSTGDASKHFQQALDVTHDMAGDLIGELKQRNISFIVAPYEADAQLAYLARKPVEAGGVHAVITEDSDMVAYGCPIILFKSQLDGSVEELNRSVLLGPVRPLIEKFEEKQQRFFGESQVALSLNTGSSQSSKKGKKKNAYLSFEGWTDEQMTLVCVLAGCDFLPSLKGMGFKTAHGLVSKCRTVAKTLRYMRQELRWMKLMSDQYVSQVFKAVETFRHSLVFDPSTLECVHLTALPQELCDKNPQELEHLGPEMDQELSMKIAVGSINPETRAEYQHAAQPPAAVRPAKPARISAFGTLPRNPITSYISQSNQKNMWTTMNASACKNSDGQVLQGGLTQTDVRSMFGASQYSASRIEKTATGTINTNSRSVLMEDANEPSSKDLDVPSQALVGPHSQLNSADMLEPSSKAFPSGRNGGFSQKSMDRSEIPPSDDDLDVIIIGSTQPEVTSPFPGKDLQRFPLSSSKKDNLGTNYSETPEGSLNAKKRKTDIDTAKKPTSGARNAAKKKLDNAARGIPSIQNFLIRKKS